MVGVRQAADCRNALEYARLFEHFAPIIGKLDATVSALQALVYEVATHFTLVHAYPYADGIGQAR